MSKTTNIPKEEIAAFYKECYEKLDKFYTLKSFELNTTSNKLHFFHGFNDDPEKELLYFAREEDYGPLFEERKASQLSGEDVSIDGLIHAFPHRAYIFINKVEKVFDFAVSWDYQLKGIGIAIYKNYLNILNALGIEDGEQYELRISTNPEHPFFGRIRSKDLVKRTDCTPDLKTAFKILEDFSNHKDIMRLYEVNKIVKYCISSGVPKNKIADAINKNGFNISYSTYNGIPYFPNDTFNEFLSFNISGLKPDCMLQHFKRNHTFGFMRLLGNVDKESAEIAFYNMKELVLSDYEERKQNFYIIPKTIEEYGILGHFIIDWEMLGFFVKHLDRHTKKQIRQLAIDMFETFDPEHTYHGSDLRSKRVFEVLSDAGLMDKDTYIELYQKALNRNYTSDEFFIWSKPYIKDSEYFAAKKEIEENLFLPSPKSRWQKCLLPCHYVPKITIPRQLGKKENVRQLLKDRVLEQETAKNTKIRTDMTGITKEGKVINVTNLKDWLFGVPGKHGNLQLLGTSAIAFPPQTPEIVLDIVKKALYSLC